MSRTATAFINFLQNQVYVNAVTDADQSNYVGQTFDITTDLRAIKNYLGIDSSLQRNAFESYSDLTDYFLIIDDSWFIKDQTTIEVTDIYFSDISDTTRYDGSMMLFTLNQLINDYSTQMNEAILHFKFIIHKYPDITNSLVYSFPLFLSSNIPQIANSLTLQYDINFISVDMFNDYALLMTLRDQIEQQYVTKLSPNLTLNFIGQNDITFIDYYGMINSMIMNNLSSAFGSSQSVITDNDAKWYIQDYTTVLKIVDQVGVNQIIDMFSEYIVDFYQNHIDWTVDTSAGFSTDTDLYEVAIEKERFVWDGSMFYDMLDVNFLAFVLIRNNIYNQKFTLLQDGTEFWSDFIKFRVKNIIPNWTYDFSYIANGFDVSIVTDFTSDLPLKVDILEYSNNLVWTSATPYSQFIGQYYFDPFTLTFNANQLNLDYGYNSIRIFLSDTLSETYKDITYAFVYAPFSVISTEIAKVTFSPEYSNIKNTQNVEYLLPLNDVTSYQDLQAKVGPDATATWMYIQVPIDYQLIYAKNVPLNIDLQVTDSTGGLLAPYEYLIWDTTSQTVNISPTLTIPPNGGIGSTFMVMFRYMFDSSVIYTEDIIQKLNGYVSMRLYPANTDTTDVNWFQSYAQIPFVTTRYQIKMTSTTTVAAQSYSTASKLDFTVPFSTTNTFSVIDYHDFNTSNGYLGQADNYGSSFYLNDAQINRTNTIKSIPVTVAQDTNIEFTISGLALQDTTGITWCSPQVGYIKQVNNFLHDNILPVIVQNYVNWMTTDLFNWYMSNVNDDIMLTYRTEQPLNFLSTAYKSEFVDSMLTSNDSFNGWTLLKYIFYYYGLDYTSSNAYNSQDVATAESKMQSNQTLAGVSYTALDMIQSFQYQMDINFSRSNIYNLENLSSFMQEAFVAKYFSDILPSEWQFSVQGNLGHLDSSGFYDFGDHFRAAYFGGGGYQQDRSSALNSFMGSVGDLMQYMSTYFCDNYQMDFTTATGEALSLTSSEVVSQYLSDPLDQTFLIHQIESSLPSILGKALSFSGIDVKTIYSADLSATVDNITSDVFSIHIAPTNISPLYSTFKITDVRYTTDSNALTITELFDKKSLTAEVFHTDQVMGTGIEIEYQYLNHSFVEVPVSVMIYYNDEYGNNKTISVTLSAQETLVTSAPSAMSDIVSAGVDTLQALQLLQVFDTGNSDIQTTINALQDGVNAIMGQDADGATNSAQTFWNGIFTVQSEYFGTYQQYLNTDVLNAFQTTYLKPLVYGLPTFGFNSGVSLFTLPENIEMLGTADAQNQQANAAQFYLTDQSYHANGGYTEYSNLFANLGFGDSNINYKDVVNSYYQNYLDKRGYDVNLILLPDTTYNISLKTYLVFYWNLTASENAMAMLDGFLSAIGGGSSGGCMLNLQQFLTLARTYSNLEDLAHGLLKDMYASLNFPSYGRVPSAEQPITIQEYYPAQQQADYNTFIESATMYYYETDNNSKAHFGFVVPFEKIVMAIDTTSNGLFDVNFITFNPYQTWKTQFTQNYVNMAQSNTSIDNWENKVVVSVQVPSVIPQEFIDVTVKCLF